MTVPDYFLFLSSSVSQFSYFEDILACDPTLAKEIEFDMRQHEKQNSKSGPGVPIRSNLFAISLCREQSSQPIGFTHSWKTLAIANPRTSISSQCYHFLPIAHAKAMFSPKPTNIHGGFAVPSLKKDELRRLSGAYTPSRARVSTSGLDNKEGDSDVISPTVLSHNNNNANVSTPGTPTQFAVPMRKTPLASGMSNDLLLLSLQSIRLVCVSSSLFFSLLTSQRIKRVQAS